MKMLDKVALVTGAALGYKAGGPSIGSAIAFRLASEGARITVVDVQEEMGERTASTIRQRGGEAIFVRADVSQTPEVIAAVEATRARFGALHCLVNCAACYDVDLSGNVCHIAEEAWDRVLDVNLGGYYRCARYAIPLILESGGGTIVNISSMAAFAVSKDYAVYPVTKAAINALTRSLAIDLAPRIRANAICPGFVRIANSEDGRTPEELERWLRGIAEGYPMQRVCSVEEIANVALFLASDDSSYVNGQCIAVDGGKSVVR